MPTRITVIPLGTSSGVPTAERNTAAVAIAFERRWILLDCGEATQHRILRSPLKPQRLDAIFVSHLHGDHLLGLPGLLNSLSLQDRGQPLAVYGPPGIRKFLKEAFKAMDSRLSYPLAVRESEGGVLLRAEGYSVSALQLSHRVPCLGFLALDLRWKLRIAYCTDTVPCRNTVELARDADLLIHEATYSDVLAEKAFDRGHSTAAQAARLAKEAGARSLLLTHFSPRYEDLAPLEAEAREIFPETIAARDLVPFVLSTPARQAA